MKATRTVTVIVAIVMTLLTPLVAVGGFFYTCFKWNRGLWGKDGSAWQDLKQSQLNSK